MSDFYSFVTENLVSDSLHESKKFPSDLLKKIKEDI